MRLLKFFIFLTVPLAIMAGTYAYLRHAFSVPMSPSDTSTVLFEIPPQRSFRAIARDLEAKHLIRHSWAFNLIAQLKRKDTSIMAGEYELSPSMTPEEILTKLVSGKMFLRKVTIKEGASIWEVGALVEAAGIGPKTEFDAMLTDPELLREAGVQAKDLEGYLFPETYQFPRSTSARKIVQTMLQEFKEVWSSEFDARAKERGMTKHVVITLASIIEKESGNFKEQPLISSVFQNRLKRGMRLQADPTVIYGLKNFDGNIRKDDLLAPTPYNTYVIDGLPPGPIANPGLSAIRAALWPAESSYLYFVADGTGNHFFSATLDEHNRAVNEYQRGVRSR